jgi:type IV pilus assembly protein PilA
VKVTKTESGFSLMELVIVVAIIGMLARAALPRLQGFRYKAIAGKAKQQLGVIRTLQKAFFSVMSTYSTMAEYG